MNYQHIYHAGSAADVFKHLILLKLLTHFQDKPKPFCSIDTHAGSGQYSLNTTPTTEWHTGVKRIYEATCVHPLLQHYQRLIQDLNHFPGSPLIAKSLLRPHDELILIEQADVPYRALKRLFRDEAHVHIHHTNTWSTAKSILPPKIRRGLVLVDPPYEQKNEFELSMHWLQTALTRWPTATYALWYPIKSRPHIQRFYQQLQKKLSHPFLVIECCLWPDDVANRLNGSGMVIINAPWQFEETLPSFMDELILHLKPHPKAHWQIHHFLSLAVK